MCDWDLIVLAIRFAVSSNFNIYLLFVANFQSYLEPSVHIFGSDKTYFLSALLNSCLFIFILYNRHLSTYYAAPKICRKLSFENLQNYLR